MRAVVLVVLVAAQDPEGSCRDQVELCSVKGGFGLLI